MSSGETPKVKSHSSWPLVAHAFSPSSWEAEAGRALEFKASLGYTKKPYFEKPKSKTFWVK